MSGIKRSLETEDNSATNDDKNEQTTSPMDSPDSKKARHSSSHSENDEETQIIDHQNGNMNGHSSSQSETEEEEEEEEEENIGVQENPSGYSPVHIDFNDGKDDIFRYDGNLTFHVRLSSERRHTEISSEPTIIRTFAWTLLSFFKPTYNNTQNDIAGSLGLFLKCEPEKSCPNWSIFAKAELTLLHATNPEKNYVKKINHLFNSRSSDWGFHNFKTLKEIHNEFVHSSDNTVRIEAKIHADPPRNVDWDSKNQTGFVGLRNIGATCYMNSFLQTIYFTKKLRKAVYALPTDSDEHSHSIPLALQKIFYDLQFTDRPINTKKLTRSFGWDKPDEFCQHDIQEFCRVLLDKLETKMEGTTMEGAIPSLFQGQYVQYIRCTSVDLESRANQTFYDVPLQVRNNANITESFRDFCKSEILTGENLYDAGSVHGLQEAEKGVKFQKFPPVLCLHLLRFEYDYNLSQNRKINDSYSFDSHLDLSEFLEKPDCSLSSYRLLSILVHSGDNSSGHYVSFINPQLDGQWFKFDDDVVARVATSDAIERNFGGIQDDDGSMFNTSAYMLLYIREDCQEDVLCDINLEDIPENLIKRFDYEKKSLVKRRQGSSDSHGSVDVQILLNNNFSIAPAACLSDLIYDNTADVSQNKSCFRYVRAQHSESFRTFAKRLVYEMGVKLDEDIRIWIVKSHRIPHNHYHSHPLLTSVLVQCDDYDTTILDLFGYEVSDRRMLSVFVEQKLFLNGIYQLLSFNKEDDICIFVRLYNSQDESLTYIGHFFYSQQQTLRKCLNDITLRTRTPVSSATTFLVHQSVPKHNQTHQYESIKSTNFDLTLSQALHPCFSGVSMIVQLFDVTQTCHTNSFTTVDDYFRNLSNRHEFDIYNRDNLRNECLFKLCLPLKTSVQEVIRLIAERIEYPEQQIILQKPVNATPSSNVTPTTASLHAGCDQTLKDLYPNIRVAVTAPRKIFFKRLPFNYSELEHRRLFRLLVSNPIKKDEQREIQFYARKSSTIADFLQEIKQWIPTLCSANGSQRLRIIELILHSQINIPFQLRICSDCSSIEEFENISNRYYHLEEVIADTTDQNNDSVLIPVAHYTKENFIHINLQKFFPFFLHVIHNETFAEVKQRLQNRLALTNREFEKYGFSIYNGSKLVSQCDDNMGRINLRELKSIQSTCWLGVELPSVLNLRKTRKSLFSEKPIRIN